MRKFTVNRTIGASKMECGVPSLGPIPHGRYVVVEEGNRRKRAILMREGEESLHGQYDATYYYVDQHELTRG